MKKIFMILAALILNSAVASSNVNRFVSINDYINNSMDYYDAQAALMEGFDQVCGDTFCEGDYSNLSIMRFTCSVEQSTGLIKDCAIVLAGSYESINAKTGKVKLDSSALVACPINLNGLDAKKTMQEMKRIGSEVLDASIQGKKTIYDQLVDCTSKRGI